MVDFCFPQELLEGVFFQEPVSLAGKKILAEQYHIVLAREAGTRNGSDIEDLHKMRVATRRMRSLLKSTKNFYDPNRIQTLRTDLRQLGHLLGEVRDMDTLVLFLERSFPQFPQSVQDTILKLIVECLLIRGKKLEALNQELSGSWYSNLKQSIEVFLREHTEDEKEQPPVYSVVPSLIENHYDKVLTKREGIHEASLEDLHRLRIYFKRLRYLCEFFSACYGKSLKELIGEFIEFQDVLGDVQDFHRQANFLQTIGKGTSSADQSIPDSSAISQLIVFLERSIEQERQKFLERWEEFCLPENDIRIRYIIRNNMI